MDSARIRILPTENISSQPMTPGEQELLAKLQKGPVTFSYSNRKLDALRYAAWRLCERGVAVTYPNLGSAKVMLIPTDVIKIAPPANVPSEYIATSKADGHRKIFRLPHSTHALLCFFAGQTQLSASVVKSCKAFNLVKGQALLNIRIQFLPEQGFELTCTIDGNPHTFWIAHTWQLGMGRLTLMQYRYLPGQPTLCIDFDYAYREALLAMKL